MPATETTSNPETDSEVLTAYAAGDRIVTRMKNAEAEVKKLQAENAQLKAELAAAEAAKQAAIAIAVADLKAKIAALP